MLGRMDVCICSTMGRSIMPSGVEKICSGSSTMWRGMPASRAGGRQEA
jgi:hypothetical protein